MSPTAAREGPGFQPRPGSGHGGLQEAEVRAEAPVRADDRQARRAGRVPEARPPAGRQQPGHVRGRGRRRRDHDPARPGPVPGRARLPLQPCRSRSGSGSPFSSPTSPRRWPRAGARRRPTRCAGPRPRRPLAGLRSRATGRQGGDGSRPPRCAKAIWSSARRATSSRATARSSRASPRSTSRPSRARARRSSARRGDRSAVTGGTCVLSDRIVIRITSNPGETFIDRMIALVEGAKRQKTPNEIALTILLSGMHHHLPPGGGDAGPVCGLQRAFGGLRRAAEHLPPVGPAGLSHPDHHRRAAVGHRDRRNGPGDAAQRAGDVGQGGGGGGRREHPPAGQDRHHHAGQPASGGAHGSARRRDERSGRCRAAFVAGRRDAGGAQHRGPGQGEVRPARTRAAAARGGVHPLHRADAHERRQPEGGSDPQGRRRGGQAVHRGAGRQGACPARRDRDRHLQGGGYAAGRGAGRQGARRHPPEGHRQGRNARPLRASPRDGDQDGDDHRRQPAYGGVHRGRGRRGRLPGGGDAGDEDGADQEGAAGRASSWR